MQYTYHYKQPDEYHFSLDSIHLAEFVASELQSHPDPSSLQILDLCAGCGVIGIELSYYVPDIKQIDFVEIQDIYTQYFYQNVATVNRSEMQFRWHLLNYDVLHEKRWTNTFDIIISNPPYFLREHGMLSPSNFKNRCRFYIDSSFENYILALENALAENGKAYFLLRPAKHHGLDLFGKIQKILTNFCISVKIISQIRGTDIVLLEKWIKNR